VPALASYAGGHGCSSVPAIAEAGGAGGEAAASTDRELAGVYVRLARSVLGAAEGVQVLAAQALGSLRRVLHLVPSVAIQLEVEVPVEELAVQAYAVAAVVASTVRVVL
jgi:hypothetical protein